MPAKIKIHVFFFLFLLSIIFYSFRYLTIKANSEYKHALGTSYYVKTNSMLYNFLQHWNWFVHIQNKLYQAGL